MPETNASINYPLNYEFSGFTYLPDATYVDGGTNFTVRLSTSDITNTGTGALEPTVGSGGGYVPQTVAKFPINWTKSVDGYVENAVAIVFPRATQDWGTIVEVYLTDNLTGAPNGIRYHTKLLPSVDVTTGTQLIFWGGTLIFGRKEVEGS